MATQITGQHINNQVDTVVGTLRSKMPDFLMYKRKRNVHTLCSIVIKTADGGNTYGQNKDQRINSDSSAGGGNTGRDDDRTTSRQMKKYKDGVCAAAAVLFAFAAAFVSDNGSLQDGCESAE